MGCPTCAAIQMLLAARGVEQTKAATIGQVVGRPLEEHVVKPVARKAKRKASKYSKEYSRQFKALKKKHPKTKFATLAKRAHRATRAKMRR